MEKIKYMLIIAVTFIALSLNVNLNDDYTDLDSFMIEAKADNGPGECAENGYKTWNGGLFGDQGKNCWCETIRKPRLQCSTDQPGEEGQ